MRATFRSELAGLMGDLAGMARLAAEMMTTASIALHQEDSTLATRVVTQCHQLRGLLGETERRCVTLLASQQAEHAATAIEHQDPLSGCQLATADDELDALLAHLLGLLVSPDWSHGVEQAVGAALIGRYYERFGDHAVAIAAQACYISTGRSTDPRALNTASSPAPVTT